MDPLEFLLEEEEATEKLGAALQENCFLGAGLHLTGELGSGKTTLVRGFLRAAGWPDSVKSPTYTLVEPYFIEEKQYYHFDLYRVAVAEELSFMGIRDYFHPQAICLVEWPERAGLFLPEPDLLVHLDHIAHGRRATIRAKTEKGQGWLLAL